MDNKLENILEGLLFVAGDGIDKGYIMEKLGVTDKQLTKAVESLKSKYCGDCGINIISYKNKIQMSSNPAYADDISLVLNPIRERNLSKATLETVAIIAYKQPVTRLEVEEIRGVNSDYALQTLMNLKMIEVVGRKDAIGKPLLFGTTEEFLKRFDLQDLNDLPDYDELLKSIEVINQENNHLYNEFEIPDEEPSDDKPKENTEENNQVVNAENEQKVEKANNLEDVAKKEDIKEDNAEILNNKVEEKQEEIQIITPLEEPKIIDDNGEDIFKDEELPDFLKDEANLQKIE